MISKVRSRQLVLLMGLMIVEREVRPVAISFLSCSYLDFADLSANKKGLTLKDMSENYGCKPQAGSRHVKHLEKHNVLVRVSAHAWRFNWDYLDRLNKLSY